jgi:hypothetical protein
MADEKQKPGVTKVDGTITENGLIIQNINIRPVQRTKEDIQSWRSKHQQAESINGVRVPLYDLYDDMLIDGFLKRLVAKRVLSVTKNKLKYVDNAGVEIESADGLLKLRQFRKLRQRLRLYQAWGIAVIEIYIDPVTKALKIFDVPKKHILPKEGKIVSEQYDVEGISYRNPPYAKTVIEVGDYDDLGYLLQAGAYAIYKRGVIADWANYAQIFGMPFREARYDGFNEVVRLQLEQALEKAASAAWIVLPKDAEFTMHEAKSGANSNELYNTLRTAMNEEMTVLILGATETMTSSKSSGYAQAETHMKTVDEVAEDDKEDELSILNELVIPVLVNLGLLPAGGTFIYDEPVDVTIAGTKVDMGIKLKNSGVPVSDDWFYEMTGIPKPDNYDELKQKFEDDKIQFQQAAANKVAPPAAGKKPVKKVSGAQTKDGAKKLSAWHEMRLKLADFFDLAR